MQSMAYLSNVVKYEIVGYELEREKEIDSFFVNGIETSRFEILFDQVLPVIG